MCWLMKNSLDLSLSHSLCLNLCACHIFMISLWLDYPVACSTGSTLHTINTQLARATEWTDRLRLLPPYRMTSPSTSWNTFSTPCYSPGETGQSVHKTGTSHTLNVYPAYRNIYSTVTRRHQNLNLRFNSFLKFDLSHLSETWKWNILATRTGTGRINLIIAAYPFWLKRPLGFRLQALKRKAANDIKAVLLRLSPGTRGNKVGMAYIWPQTEENLLSPYEDFKYLILFILLRCSIPDLWKWNVKNTWLDRKSVV